MPTNYTGNANGGAQAPAPAPAPASIPIGSLPVDADALNSASIYQLHKTELDHITHLNTTAKWRPPRTPSGVTGFTAVTHAGTGPSTGCAPSVVSATLAQPTSTPYNLIFKIILGGAVGTATFQVSTDGGNTYGATVTTAATYLEPTSGVTVAFTGTLVANDTYSFSGTDTPMAAFVDQSANNHGVVVDHLGNPGGRRSEFREDWAGIGSVTVGTSSNAAIGRWQGYTGASGGVTGPNSPPSSANIAWGPYVIMSPGGTASSQAALALGAGAAILNPLATGIVFAQEFEFAVSSWTLAKLTAYFGLCSTVNPWSSGDFVGFYTTTSGSIFASYGPSGSITNTPLSNFTLVGASAPNIRGRIEYHGSASPLGNCIRFFLNETLVWTTTTSMPTAALFPFFAGFCGTAANSAAAYVGSVYAGWNRWANPAIL